jgi:hypothetical protein
LYPPPVIKHEGWHIDLQAIYAQSIFNTQTATTQTSPELIPYTWSLGYKTQVSYLFEKNLDINLNWLYFNTNINQTIQSSDNLNGQFTVNQFGSKMSDGDVSQINQVVTNIENTTNTINFEFGRTSALNESIDVRFQMGFQYANIHEVTSQTASNTSINRQFNYNDAQINTKFSGIGPRTGFDVNYKLGYGFSIVNGASFALPTGNTTINDTSTQSNITNTGIGNISTISYKNLTTIFDYTEALSVRFQQEYMDSLWLFDTGYQISDYDIAEQSGLFFSIKMIH